MPFNDEDLARQVQEEENKNQTPAKMPARAEQMDQSPAIQPKGDDSDDEPLDT